MALDRRRRSPLHCKAKLPTLTSRHRPENKRQAKQTFYTAAVHSGAVFSGPRTDQTMNFINKSTVGIIADSLSEIVAEFLSEKNVLVITIASISLHCTRLN